MDTIHERSLVERWPDWFAAEGAPWDTLMHLGFQHGNAWFGLVYQLCEQLEPLVQELNRSLQPSGERFRVLEVKQKMGALRFCVNHHTEAIDAAIEAARLRSLQICEVCCRLIRTVELRNHNGWLVTLCADCESQYRRRIGSGQAGGSRTGRR
jgi:hypothetical protein